jgi:arabinofuranosyltransferase
VRTALESEGERQLRRATMIVGTTLLVVALIRTAWLCDDAFITFRTADNIVNGFGAVWNVGERVQSYTHPLWLALFLPVYALTREPYSAIALGVLLTLAAVGVVMARLAPTAGQRLVCFAALLSSKGFIDYSTSGLENPLAHVLLAAFVWQWWEEPDGERRLTRLGCLAGLCALTRLDLIVLVGPAIAADAYRFGLRAALRPLAVGLLPFLAWELFSLVYYGAFLPNTAYAKLNTGIPSDVLWSYGALYFKRTSFGDPVTLLVILLAPFVIPAARWRRDWPLVVGIVLFCMYVFAVGGDFMMSRFFTAPFFMGVALLSRAPWLGSTRHGIAAMAVCVAVGLCASWEPALFSGYGYTRFDNFVHGIGQPGPRDHYANLFVDRIADERRYYDYDLALLRTRGVIKHDWAERGRDLRRQQRAVSVMGNVGLTGFYAGPAVHIVDSYALTDPLLARLPALKNSRIGHFRRNIPEGYVDTIASGVNQIADPRLARYYDQLQVIVSGPLWSWRRFATIATLPPRP